MNEKHSEFAPADDVFAALESIPGLNDDKPQRDAAREQMERCLLYTSDAADE